MELYEPRTNEEREAILQAMVGWVVMDEKETGTCELAFLQQIPDAEPNRFELTNQVGAASDVISNRFPLLEVPVELQSPRRRLMMRLRQRYRLRPPSPLPETPIDDTPIRA